MIPIQFPVIKIDPYDIEFIDDFPQINVPHAVFDEES